MDKDALIAALWQWDHIAAMRKNAEVRKRCWKLLDALEAGDDMDRSPDYLNELDSILDTFTQTDTIKAIREAIHARGKNGRAD